MNTLFTRVAVVTLVASTSLLVACKATQRNSAPIEPVQTTPSVNTAPDTTTKLKTTPGKVQAVFTRASVKTIFDRLAEIRAKKNMKVKTRSKTQLTMALKIPAQSGKPAEEIRITYLAQTSGNEVLITSKASRASNPDTFDEKLTDLTKDLAEKLQAELNDVQSDLG